MAGRAVGVIAGTVLLLHGGARDAAAWVPYVSTNGRTLSLPPCVLEPITVYPGTFSQMTVEEVTSAATAAAAAWSASANACTYLVLDVKVVPGPARRASNDGMHTIVMRDTSWCKLDAAGSCDPTSTAYDPQSLALTTITARSSTGEIVDADIEINAFHYLWADRVAHPELADRYDLQNELTRQIGHLVGLDYNCFNPAGGGTRAVDDAGNPVPDCATASAAVQATTMFPSNVVGDVARRTLEPDDRAGVCELYPATLNPCDEDGGVGCVCTVGGADGGQDAGGGADASATDAPPTDAGTMSSDGGGCGCETSGGPSGETWPALAFLLTALVVAARRQTERQEASVDATTRASSRSWKEPAAGRSARSWSRTCPPRWTGRAG